MIYAPIYVRRGIIGNRGKSLKDIFDLQDSINLFTPGVLFSEGFSLTDGISSELTIQHFNNSYSDSMNLTDVLSLELV
jgi:ssRNA-specific RNase YbeY (16S rRNA maturation enzyme)